MKKAILAIGIVALFIGMAFASIGTSLETVTQKNEEELQTVVFESSDGPWPLVIVDMRRSDETTYGIDKNPIIGGKLSSYGLYHDVTIDVTAGQNSLGIWVPFFFLSQVLGDGQLYRHDGEIPCTLSIKVFLGLLDEKGEHDIYLLAYGWGFGVTIT